MVTSPFGELSITRTAASVEVDALPSLTVLSALPGWGKTTWLRQALTALTQQWGRARVHWIASPSHLASWLASAPPETTGCAVVMDDVLFASTDRIWDDIATFLADHPRSKVLTSSIDLPPASIMEALDTRVLDEDDLRFTTGELSDLIEKLPAANFDLLPACDAAARGCPSIVSRHIQALAQASSNPAWILPKLTPEADLFSTAGAITLQPRARKTTMVTLLRRAAHFRRFSPSLLADNDFERDEFTRHATRLTSLPGISVADNPETGLHDYVWSERAWASVPPPTPLEPGGSPWGESLRRLRAQGIIVGQLPYHIADGDLDAAEALVAHDLRRFLLFSDDVLTSSVAGLTTAALKSRPALAVLTAELRARRDGPHPRTRSLEALALGELDALEPTSATDALRIHALRAFAATGCGFRADATRTLTEVLTLWRSIDTEGVPVDPSPTAGWLYLAYWAAIQTDQHDAALTLSRTMVSLQGAADRTAAFDGITATTQADLYGLRSLHGDPDPAVISHTAPLLFLETGDDHAAIDRIRPLLHLPPEAPSRSALDAMVLLTSALVPGPLLRVPDVLAVVERSRKAWDDHEPSSFVRFGACVALCALDATAEARHLINTAPAMDWYTETADALVALVSDDATQSLQALERTPTPDAPRLAAISGCLAASALAALDHEAAAREHLTDLWHRIPSPRLLRFGLRFVPDDLFGRLAAGSDATEPALQGVLDSARGDHRALTTAILPTLSPSELEVLALIRQGLTNREIGERRFVTDNTVRAQIKAIYRKLGVPGRNEAVREAERWGFFRQ